MNTPFNLTHWLKQQAPMTPPADDFEAIYQQVKPVNDNKNIMPWALAATLGLLTISLLFLNQTGPTDNQNLKMTGMDQLTQQIRALEQNLKSEATALVSQPGSALLENQVQLEQWLSVINDRLKQINNSQQRQTLLNAKRTVLQSLAAKNHTIQLI